jgi:hypothetical protein
MAVVTTKYLCDRLSEKEQRRLQDIVDEIEAEVEAGIEGNIFESKNFPNPYQIDEETNQRLEKIEEKLVEYNYDRDPLEDKPEEFVIKTSLF